MTADALFAGPMPELYDRHLGPVLFEPYAEVLAARLPPDARDVLETEAGTGIVTLAVLAARPDARLTATDLNGAMLDVAAAKPGAGRAAWAQAMPRRFPSPTRASTPCFAASASCSCPTRRRRCARPGACCARAAPCCCRSGTAPARTR